MNEGMPRTTHHTLTVQRVLSGVKRAHFSVWGVVCGGSLLVATRVRRGKVASSLPLYALPGLGSLCYRLGPLEYPLENLFMESPK